MRGKYDGDMTDAPSADGSIKVHWRRGITDKDQVMRTARVWFRSSNKLWHSLGVAAVDWGLLAWLEWYAIPIVYPDRGGPVPYINFAVQAIALLLGCAFWAAIVLLLPTNWKRSIRVAYVVVPASYVVFQGLRLAAWI